MKSPSRPSLLRLVTRASVWLLLGACHPGSSRASAAEPGPPPAAAAMSAAERTDSFEEKMRLLQEAWQRKDFDLARALTHSLRSTVVQAAEEEASPGVPLMGVEPFGRVESLPPAWREWAAGWKYWKGFTLSERAGEDRGPEPVEILVAVSSTQADSLAREIRVAQVAGGVLREIPCQVHGEVRRGSVRYARVVMLPSLRAREQRTCLLFYGNPEAELPAYPTDLETRGEGVGLDVENEFFKAVLSRQTGQLERLVFKREHGLELFSGGEGHGEPPGIDWAHDYVDAGNFQKLRISLWDACPDFEVVRGPLCTIVRRWGFPYSPVHPIYAPSRLEIEVEYRFYAGVPWFHKLGSMRAVKEFEAAALRDDEWVFSGQSFTDPVWMGEDGRLQLGEVPGDRQQGLWGVGFVNRQTQDAFIGLFLEHRAEGLPELKHTGAPMLHYRWHGSVWSRYPLPVTRLPAGATLHQKNAYTVVPYSEPEGRVRIEHLRAQLTQPVVAARVEGDLPTVGAATGTGRLARPGEAGDSPIPKQKLWEALHGCKDAQLYTADIDVVELGLVYDLQVRGDVVKVVLAMPHRGRPLAGYFSHGSISVHPTASLPIREQLMRVPGVGKVIVEQVWSPAWSSNRLTDEGRRKLGLPLP
ncbi:MAG TPA: hypothetical protein DCM86_09805 [Verrucomicrobiales bacterium]|nr:hypothetical protein [Verrucomicrobiales bacterium]